MATIKNPAYADKELTVGRHTYKGDEYGVFDVPDEVATTLASLAGFFRPRITKEQQKAYKLFKKAEKKLKIAQDDHDDAKRAMVVAQAEADSGRGTAVEAPKRAVEEEDDPEPEEEEEEAPEESEEEESEEEESEDESEEEDEEEESEEESEEEDEDESEEEDEEEDEANEALEAIAKGEEPNMKWTQSRLVSYANAMDPPIAADKSWTKATIIGEIESRYEE